MMIETAWKRLSTDSIDFFLKSRTLRNIALKGAEKSLHKKYVVVNKQNRPKALQEGRCKILMNLMHAVHRALSDGRISPKVRKAIISNFVGRTVLNNVGRTAEFFNAHGFDPPTFSKYQPDQEVHPLLRRLLCIQLQGKRRVARFRGLRLAHKAKDPALGIPLYCHIRR